MPLPALLGRQREVLALPGKGHVVVLGTAGSGKTVTAAYRAAFLADTRTDHGGPTLLVVFNNSLAAHLRAVRELRGVTVETYHRFARGYLNARGRMTRNAICRSPTREGLIERARQQVLARGHQPILDAGPEFLSEEIRWIARHGYSEREDYRRADRIGRGAPLLGAARDGVFDVLETYKELRAERGYRFDWDDVAGAARQELESDDTDRRYRHIVIDEGQCFSPEMLRSLVLAVPAEGSVTLFADIAQEIYGRHRLPWRAVGLVVPRAWAFDNNYRNSQEIAALAAAITQMPYFEDVADAIVHGRPPTHAGPMPTLVTCSDQQTELELIISQAREASRTGSVAILCRLRSDEGTIIAGLPRDSVRLHRTMGPWSVERRVYYGTIHAASGLEFDTVILPFLTADRLPDPGTVDRLGREEATKEDGRLLYVGVTRARTRLVLSHTGLVTDLLPTDQGLYQRVRR